MNPKEQGRIGERAAARWLLWRGATVYVPFPEHSDVDLVADLDGRLVRVQAKTTIRHRDNRWQVQLSTRGGNQSWNGTVKYLDATRCDFVFVLVGDGRQWFIPAGELGGSSGILVGGPRYSDFEVESGRPTLEELGLGDRV